MSVKRSNVRCKLSQCEKHYSSIIGSTVDEIENFSFNAVWPELSQAVSTLASILEQLVAKKNYNNTLLLCLIAKCFSN